MKVVVSFGGTKVVVPCGSGETSVSEVLNQALLRIKKALYQATGVVLIIVFTMP